MFILLMSIAHIRHAPLKKNAEHSRETGGSTPSARIIYAVFCLKFCLKKVTAGKISSAVEV